MRKILMVLGILTVLILSGCVQEQIIPDKTTEINSFVECVAAGHAVMESYPEQCSANGRTFTADRPPIQKNEFKETNVLTEQECEAYFGEVVDHYTCVGGANNIGKVKVNGRYNICCSHADVFS